MIKKVENIEKDVINYIAKDYYKCIYLYLDIKKYGILNPNVKSWIQQNEDGDTICVLLKYYTGMHIYSKKRDYNLEEISKLIYIEKPTMICGEQKTIEDIYDYINDDNYLIEKGWVRELSEIDEDNIDNYIQKAEKDDFKQIAKLLYEDEDLGSSYELEELEKQLYERKKEGYSRNYIIKESGMVVSHAGTGAEDDKLGMLAYVITDPQYRGNGYAKKVCKAVCRDLISEGKNVYLINYSNESTALYDKIGFHICCNWAKMYIDLKNF